MRHIFRALPSLASAITVTRKTNPKLMKTIRSGFRSTTHPWVAAGEVPVRPMQLWLQPALVVEKVPGMLRCWAVGATPGSY